MVYVNVHFIAGALYCLFAEEVLYVQQKRT